MGEVEAGRTEAQGHLYNKFSLLPQFYSAGIGGGFKAWGRGSYFRPLLQTVPQGTCYMAKGNLSNSNITHTWTRVEGTSSGWNYEHN